VPQIAIVNRHFEAVPTGSTATLFVMPDTDDLVPLDPGSLPQFRVEGIAQRQPFDRALNQQVGLVRFVQSLA
jgi:hypothetical protein